MERGNMRREKWIFLFMGIVIGLLVAFILTSIKFSINSTQTNIILACLLAIATFGCWYAASASAKTAKQSYDYIKLINQPSVELVEWKTWLARPDFRLQFTLEIKGKEHIILRNVSLTFFFMYFDDVYKTENKYHITLHANSQFSGWLIRNLPPLEFGKEKKSWNPDIKEEVKQAKLFIGGILLLRIEFTRENDNEIIPYDIALYNFHVTDRLLHLDDYEEFKHKIPKSFREQLDRYFGLH